MTNKVKCPYCGVEIENNITKCPNCGEYFVERTLPVKIDSLGQFIVFSIITCGIYPLVWLFLNLPKFDLMAVSGKDRIKLIIPIFLVTLLFIPITSALIFLTYYLGNHMQSFLILSYVISGYVLVPMICAGIILYYIIAYRMLRIIEKYTYKEYGVELHHNDMCWFLFGFLYVLYYIYTYNRRVCANL